MKKSKTKLLCKIISVILLIITVLLIIVKTKIIKYESKYLNENEITGTVYKYEKTNDKLKIYLQGKEKIIATSYDDINVEISIGDEIMLQGDMNTPSNNTLPNTFNYKKYLYNHGIYKTFTIKKIVIINNNKNIFNKIKNSIYKRCENSTYLKLFILGDKSSMEKDMYSEYKNVGIAHLLAVSGMHVGMFILLLGKLLFFIPKKWREILISIFLIFYAYLVSFSASILRVVIFYIIGRVFKRMPNIKKLYYTGIILLMINPFFIYDTGFIYSFVTVFGIIIISKYLTGNYFKDILIISFYSMLFTLPITALLNYEINFVSLIGNLIFIPIVSFVIYPASLITFTFPSLMKLYLFLTSMMENILNVISNIKFLTINIPRMPPFLIVIYYASLIASIYLNKKRFLFIIIIILGLNKLIPYFDISAHVFYLDVGQGDSSLIVYPHQRRTVLIDTGGNQNYSLADNLILFFKSKGITKLDYIILSHGDFDHMGETINLVNNFKVENVIFNCGEYNDLENELIKVLDKNKIKHYSCIKELNIDKYKLEFLNTKEYDNENDNSNVIYFNFTKHELLFMGDAGIDKEKDMLEKYNLKDIEFLKVGHHGSNTSSSKCFIDGINPKYSLISVGKDNRYGHPKDEVLDILKNSKIYRTDLDGSIEIKLNKNGYKIRTCPP